MLAKIDNIEKIKIIPSLQKIKIKDNCHIISEEEGLEKAKKILFNKFLSYVRDVDTIITKYMNKYISVSVSFLLAKTSITPNIITTINLIIGIVASLILILEGTKAIPENRYLTAISGILFNLASIFDGCDGEVARLKYLESNFGVIYDSMVDDITNALFILALSIFLHKESIGIILVGIYILTKFFQILGAKRKKERDYVKYELTVLKSENKLSKIIQFASSLARNDFFSFLVMIFAILNRYDILFGGIIIYVSIFFIIVFTQYIRDVRGG
jgi:CDP-L-myo-inositol myo-inositolphosphotransferase